MEKEEIKREIERCKRIIFNNEMSDCYDGNLADEMTKRLRELEEQIGEAK